MRGQGRGSCTRTLAGTSTGTCDNPTKRKAAHTSTRLNRRRGSQPVLSFLTQKNMPLNSSQLSMPSQSSSTSHIKSSTSPIVTLGNFRRFMVAKIFSLVIFPTSFLTSTEKTRCKFSNSSRAAISSPTDLSSCPPRGITNAAWCDGQKPVEVNCRTARSKFVQTYRACIIHLCAKWIRKPRCSTLRGQDSSDVVPTRRDSRREPPSYLLWFCGEVLSSTAPSFTRPHPTRM